MRLDTPVDFAALFENDLDACVLCDARQVVLRVNRAFEQLFGYSAAEAEGRNLDQLIVPPERRDESRAWQDEAGSGGVSQDTVRRRRDGSLVDVWVLALPLEQSSGEVLVYVQYRDVSAQKRAEDALRSSEAQLRALFEYAPVGIALVDPLGHVLNANPAFARMLGWDLTELIGMHVRHTSHPDDLALTDRVRAELLDGVRDRIDVEKRYLRRDGSFFWGHLTATLIRTAEGEPLHMLGVVEDVTQSRQTAQRREAALALFESLIENMRDAVLVESAERRIAAVNPAFLAMLGLTGKPDELIGVDCRSAARQAAVLMEDPQEFVAVIERRIAEGVRGSDQLRFRDGRVFDRDYAPIRDPHRRITGHIWEYHELTDLLKLQDQLRHSQKMEAVGRLAGGIAHDFNNLLTVLQGHAAMLLEEPLPQAVQSDVHEILKAANKAANLTRQLLAYSRQQVLKPVILNLVEVVRDLERTLLRMIGEDITLQVQTAADTPLVRADRTQIEQVILNLAVNARDAMPNGGTLHVTATRAQLEHELPGRDVMIPPGDYAELIIRDTGDGIDEAVLPRIFDPFFTTKEQGKGTGLGLSTVYGIVKQTGGYLAVRSQRGAGATFTIYLPSAA